MRYLLNVRCHPKAIWGDAGPDRAIAGTDGIDGIDGGQVGGGFRQSDQGVEG
jgi:hypothetical protein